MNEMAKKFTMRDEGFICENCAQPVDKLCKTARNHCPYCLVSKHVDNNPGDRMEACHGLMVPIDIVSDNKNNYQIVVRCERCGAIKKNKMAADDDFTIVLKIIDAKSKQVL